MTVRKFKDTDIKNIAVIQKSMDTPRGLRYIDHIIHFTNGAVVAYGDKEHNGFVWVMEAAQ